ncbi:MAG: GGDEF domain-containing protein [Pseudomonadota bacterium]
MSLLDKITGRKRPATAAAGGGQGDGDVSLLDGSLDTLSAVLRTMGEFSFELEEDTEGFPDRCAHYARHVATGAGIEDEGISKSDDGQREWGRVRRFYTERRQQEAEFVEERLRNYRLLVEDLAVGLRSVATREALTETAVRSSLGDVERAAETGSVADIRGALATAITTVVQAFNEQRRQFEAQLSQSNARMMSLRRDLAVAREDLKRDPLTDAYNRGAFDTGLQQAVALNFLLRQPTTIVMLDLDNFKSINDEYGHAAGDDILRSVADCLARTFVRRSDLVARYGGEEFALILADVDVKAAEPLVERFLDTVRSTVKIPYAGNDRIVTCSAGLTELMPSDTVETVLLRADRALYRAKREGRDRVQVEISEAA